MGREYTPPMIEHIGWSHARGDGSVQVPVGEFPERLVPRARGWVDGGDGLRAWAGWSRMYLDLTRVIATGPPTRNVDRRRVISLLY